MTTASAELSALGNEPLADDVKTQRRRRAFSLEGFGASWAWIFLLPAITLFIVFDYYPFIRALILSFQSTDLFGRPAGFAGLENYQRLFSSGSFWGVFGWTLAFTVISVFLKITVGIAIALPLTYRLAGTWVMRSAVLIPMAVSTAVGTLVFGQVFKPLVGVADQLTTAMGLGTMNWLLEANTARAAVLIVDLWAGISFVVLLLMASIDSISNDVTEAAELDSCTGFRYVWHILLPSISPMILFLLITQSVAALREFTIFDVLTAGGPRGSTTTLVVDLYNKAFGSGTNDLAGAAASGLVLFSLILVLSLIQLKLSERKVNY